MLGEMRFNPARKLVITAGLFAVAVGVVLVSSATRSAVPLFFAWIPLLTVPWVLTRPESPPPPVPDLSEREEGQGERRERDDAGDPETGTEAPDDQDRGGKD